MTDIKVTIADEDWKRVGDANEDEGGDAGEFGDQRAQLHATLTINGYRMHLEAWEIIPGADPQAVRQLSDETFGMLHSGFGADGPFETTTIAGREYVVFASPYC